MSLKPQFLGDLVTFTKEILNGKLNFWCSPTAFLYKRYQEKVLKIHKLTAWYFIKKEALTKKIFYIGHLTTTGSISGNYSKFFYQIRGYYVK